MVIEKLKTVFLCQYVPFHLQLRILDLKMLSQISVIYTDLNGLKEATKKEIEIVETKEFFYGRNINVSICFS